jgi:hypothetical protein
MARCVQRTLLSIQTTAKEYVGRSLGADDMLPLFIFVLINSNILNFFQVVGYMSDFLTESEKIGEPGYCLVTFEAAGRHVLNM